MTGDFAARVSVGADWPDGSACPVGDVLIASGYEGAADTIVPRLMAQGADLRRVHFLEGFARADAYEKPPAGGARVPAPVAAAPKPARVVLEGFVKGGVVHLLEGELPEGIFVKVVRE